METELSKALERENSGIQTDEYFEFKSLIHNKLLDVLDLTVLDKVDPSILKPELKDIVNKVLNEHAQVMPLNAMEREKFFTEILDEVLGFGPLEPLLQDPTVSDILVNSYNSIYVERFGKLSHTNARFKDNDHLKQIIDKIVSAVGRRIDESSPMVDARLMDGSRVNAIIPPLALDGPMLSIRRFSVDPLELDDLFKFKTLTPKIGELLRGIVQSRLNVLISGGTGSGKTTFLNVLSRFIPPEERVITIEDSAELQLKQDHVVRLETRPPNIEGKGEVTQRELVINSLRMRPDRIILGEVRGKEAFDMLQAMNTGHDGSLTTIHANTPRDAIMRLETMVAMANFDIPSEFLRRYISSAIDVVIHVSRLSDGTRKLMSVQEITGMEGNTITMQEIFAFEQMGIDKQKNVRGKFVFRGIRPKFIDRFIANGIRISPEIFDSENL